MLVAAVGRAVPEPAGQTPDAKAIRNLLKPLVAAAFAASPEHTNNFMLRFSSEAFTDVVMENLRNADKISFQS